MFRYIALIWDPKNPEQVDAAQTLVKRMKSSPSRWQDAFDRAGLAVFCADFRRSSFEAHPLTWNCGVVLGSLFARNADIADSTPARRATLDSDNTAAILSTRGQWLVNHCWGNYVAFIADRRSSKAWVLKDPSGNLPCFSTSYRGFTIVFSAVSDCLDLLPLQLTPSREYLSARLCGGDMMQPRNALNGVTQIHRGECVEFDFGSPSDSTRRWSTWSPLQFPQADEPLEVATSAEHALRGTLRSCCWTLAAGHDAALHRLSGGLDSSIVLSCLKDAPRRPHVLSYTHYMTSRLGDSRPWARLAAEDSHCEHVEFEVVPRQVRLQSLLDIAPSAEPTEGLRYLIAAEQERQLAGTIGATAVFNGDGGDGAFGGLCVGEVLPGYLRRHGLGPGVFRLVSQVALVLRQTAWTTLGRTVRAWATRRSVTSIVDAEGQIRKLVAPGVLQDYLPGRDFHPWLGPLDRASWEVASKLSVLLGTPDLYDNASHASAAAPEVIAPIYAQPMIELCLRIPADVLFTDGRDRGLARRAFSGDVPDAIINRTWKDRPGNFHQEVIQHNLDWLRETFLDGVLVKEGLLDRAAVERVLSPRLTKDEVFPAEIFGHLDTEIWARQWTAQSSGALRAA